MSIQSVKEHLKQFNYEKHILEFQESSATVEQAANVLGVIPARIAKTLSFNAANGGALLVVAAGDAKIDNAKFKVTFETKAKMLTADDVVTYTGHQIGGVCPFGLTADVPVFLDISMKRFTTVFPACGSANSAIELTCEQLEQFSFAQGWVDVCKGWDYTLLQGGADNV
ncbi:YbaK/EbsC family protein [Solibacillus sp. CAU 1738]|uniref:YbaK/EbsC family protein n=1 Tax=Solibacillus sp. CAU 1738 TaxID=3140363 RepID=UPI0032615734